MQLPFGEWLPDQPDHLNPGATVATNVYHAQSSYKPVKGLVAYSGTSNVTKNAKGAGSFRDNTNTVFTFSLCAAFHASACSRPPPPITSIFIVASTDIEKPRSVKLASRFKKD